MTALGGDIKIEGEANIQTTSHSVILQHGYSSNLTITNATINVSGARSTSLARKGRCDDNQLEDIC